MTLCDASPLVALIDTKQIEASARCAAVLPRIPAPLITTWPCFVEAMHLLGSRGGWPMQRLLWAFVERNALAFYDLTTADRARMQALMEKYSNVPMDLADASLVVAAEALKTARIFTLDSDFTIYRINEHDHFEIVP
jgi:uncharacterized protein